MCIWNIAVGTSADIKLKMCDGFQMLQFDAGSVWGLFYEMGKTMKSDYCMTMQEAQKEMDLYRKIFTVVRLLGQQDIELLQDSRLTGNVSDCCECYAFWKKSRPCENCISMKVWNDKSQRTKLEFQGDDIYQVVSRYVEIDGVPYVMELVKRMSEETLLDPEGRKKLVSKLAGYNDKLYLDALTGAYNRRYFEDELKNRTDSVGVAMIDMDDFKLTNDTYGHNAGDAALDTMVRVIRGHIRKTDLLIRYGGDEFLLLMSDVTEEIFEEKLKQIQKKISDSGVNGYPRLKLSVSIGGLISTNEPLERAVDRADHLMYLAKNRKNMVVTERSAGPEETEEFISVNGRIRSQILIVDDSEMNRELLAAMLGDEFSILEASNGEECIDMLQQYGTGISLVLLDIVMPGMNGFEVLSVMNRKHWIDDIPVIMISSEDAASIIRRAYELGVSDYISRPFDAKVVYQRVYNTIKLYAKQRRLTSLISDQIYEKEKNNKMMVSILSHIVEFRNGESGLHVLHINILTEKLLEQLVQKTDKYNLTQSDRSLITTASSLHDIGKIGIDDKILNKPGKLTKEEFEIMKTHTLIGANMLEGMGMYQNEKLIKIAYQICRWHHERYDGKGYPDGLKGEDIPISAQVVALADVYDALSSERVYKKAFSHEKTMEMILAGECGQFNPLLLECLVEIQDILREELHNQ